MKNYFEDILFDAEKSENELIFLEYSLKTAKERINSCSVSQFSQAARQKGFSADRIGDITAHISELEGEITKRKKRNVILHKKIEAVLNKMKDSKYYNLLNARINLKMTWEQIAEAIGCDVRTVYRMRKKAFEEFYTVLKAFNSQKTLSSN